MDIEHPGGFEQGENIFFQRCHASLQPHYQFAPVGEDNREKAGSPTPEKTPANMSSGKGNVGLNSGNMPPAPSVRPCHMEPGRGIDILEVLRTHQTMPCKPGIKPHHCVHQRVLTKDPLKETHLGVSNRGVPARFTLDTASMRPAPDGFKLVKDPRWKQ